MLGEKKPIYVHEYCRYYLFSRGINKTAARSFSHRSCLLNYYRYFGERWSGGREGREAVESEWDEMTGKGANDRGGKKRGENARHVNVRRPRRYIKRSITINSEDAVYRAGTRKGINPRELSADTGR